MSSPRRYLISVIVAVWAASGCGSTSKTSGAGGVGGGAGGQAAGVCAPGDTRTCVGPAACAGGQLCAANHAWSACDCGASGGQPGTGGAGGTAGTGNAGYSGTPAGGGAPANPGDDACPTGPMIENCTDQCGGPLKCSAAECPTVTPTDLGHATLAVGTVLVRTPHAPGKLCTCSDSATVAAADSLAFQNLPVQDAHVTTPASWYVAFVNDFASAKGCAVPQNIHCLSLTSNFFDGWTAVVWTTDPNAPAVNLIVESGDCPP